MSWSLVRLVVPCALWAGCFYTDQVNQRPSIEIQQTSDDLVYRDSEVELVAVSSDPEDHLVYFQWRAYACTDAEPLPDGKRPGCDAIPFSRPTGPTNKFKVPKLRVDEPVPVQVVLVILEAQDDYGAIARPRQELLIPISDHAPVLKLSMHTRYEYIVDRPLELYAKVSDQDDGPASTQPLTWTVFSPSTQPAFELDEIDVPDPDPLFLELGKRFTPHGIGKWEVEVTATDPLGVSDTESFIIEVAADKPPCLAQWAPIAAPTGSAWPMTDPTLFQISVVEDALDPYPTVPGDPELGTTAFSWSIKQPGAGTRTALGNTGNQASLDPANYAPGDIVELRVEIEDRNQTAINCTDANPTCSVISDAACIQRLTWRVEVR